MLENQKFKIDTENFGRTSHGDSVLKYTITNGTGLEMSVINYGGIISSLVVPDKNRKYQDIVLGFDSFEGYMHNEPYFGAIIGRFANRIATGEFSLDGKIYRLKSNDGPNHLHGGEKGFDKKIWNVEPSVGENSAALKLTYLSPDGEEGYPGNLKTTVIYTLTEDHILDVAYTAVSDKKTILNFTQHSYFNLSANFKNSVTDHIVQINADQFLPVDKTLIPTGELRAVAGTPFDFTKPVEIAKGLEEEKVNEQLKLDPGYDHCWILNNQEKGLRFAASAYHPDSGRFMEVYTDEPGLQFYLGNLLDGTLPAKGGGTYNKRTGFCIETQHYPNAPNVAKFPSVVLNPGEEYSSNTRFQFSVK